jgi:hypothetical protein
MTPKDMRSYIAACLVAAVSLATVLVAPLASAAQKSQRPTSNVGRSARSGPAVAITLLDAAEQDDRATALRLLARGGNPNAAGPDGTTPIMWAAANDDIELVRALIKAGANVKATNQFGTRAITEAATIGSATIFEVLLKAGADPII